MDETLIKASTDPQKLVNGVYDRVTLMSIMDTKKRDVYISFRPYLFEMLDKLKKHFELIIFTAGFKDYADSIVEEIQRDDKYFDHVITREHCTSHPNGKY